MRNNLFVFTGKQHRVLALLCCLLALACAGVGFEYAQVRRELERLKRENSKLDRQLVRVKKRQKIAEALTCRGNASPLSDGELFALGMQDYWKRRVESVWKDTAPAARFNCNPSKDGCYPWKLPEISTVEQLKTGLGKITGYYLDDQWIYQSRRPDELYYETIVRVVLHGHVNHPEIERMYLPEYADGSANFGVLHYGGDWTRWYGAGCCRLMTFAEANAESLELRRQGRTMTGIPLGNDSDLNINTESHRYLRVQYCIVDSTIDSGAAGVNSFR